jgi:hypothetical protein
MLVVLNLVQNGAMFQTQTFFWLKFVIELPELKAHPTLKSKYNTQAYDVQQYQHLHATHIPHSNYLSWLFSEVVFSIHCSVTNEDFWNLDMNPELTNHSLIPSVLSSIFHVFTASLLPYTGILGCKHQK